ncbi:hypothetical protein FQA39_LY14335 [Lamprigera yunnana]|nr:hypothetical protein FQA39_LY14335 [Lamprigera yunnana]
MRTTFGVCLIFLALFCRKGESSCINVLSEEEQKCAEPLHMDAQDVLNFILSNSEDPKFEKYMKCVWTKWNYVDKHGNILYNNLHYSCDVLPWQILRICQDMEEYIARTRLSFEKAVRYCEKHPPHAQTPLLGEGRCVNILSQEEKECAAPLDLGAKEILGFIFANSEDPKFAQYVKCVWTKWNYVNKYGDILYDNLYQSCDVLPWKILRICQNEENYIARTRLSFEKAIKYCQKNPPRVQTPVAVRKCIVENR